MCGLVNAKQTVNLHRQLVEREKFPPHNYHDVSRSVRQRKRSFCTLWIKTENAVYCLENLMSKLVEDCEQLLSNAKLVSSSSKTALRLTWQASHRNG